MDLPGDIDRKGKNQPGQRKSVRLRGYDYTSPGAYFITICTNHRKCIFGDVVDGEMLLNQYGYIVQKCWEEISQHFLYIDLDEFVLMPNHIHGIIHITGVQHNVPLREAFGKPVAGSISTMIRSFKSAVSKHINEMTKNRDKGVWQRNFYEHVIRSEDELGCIREYIKSNPARWEYDRNNPACKPGKEPGTEAWMI